MSKIIRFFNSIILIFLSMNIYQRLIDIKEIELLKVIILSNEFDLLVYLNFLFIFLMFIIYCIVEDKNPFYILIGRGD